MNEINYDEKIKTFQLMTENFDHDLAINYLSKYNWDETKAVQNFFNDIHNNSNFRQDRIHPQAHYTDQLHENDAMMEAKENLLKPNNNITQNPPVVQRQIQQPTSIWQSFKNYVRSWIFCTKSNDEDQNVTASFLNNVPGKLDRFDIFVNNIRSKIGILILYHSRKVDHLEQFFNVIRSRDYLCDILRENYVILALDVNSNEGNRVINLLNEQFLTPSFLFLFNTNQRNLNRNSLIDRLEGEFSEQTFQESLIHNIELAESKRNNLNTQTRYDEENSHAAMIKMQKDELIKLEEMEREKKRKEIEEEKRIKKENEEKLKKEKEKEEKRKIIVNNLPPEPSENEPNSTKIVFRYPDLNRRIERRFLKIDTINVLYDFVDSLGKDIFMESENYELVQTFPFKLYSNKEKTLLEEGLFPNAVIQIREV